MEEILRQIEDGLQANLYYLSLFTSLAIPDICGALDAPNGEAHGKHYIRWFNEHVVPRYMTDALEDYMPSCHNTFLSSVPPYNETNAPFTGQMCYWFRCSLLHQGSTEHPGSPFDKILFVPQGIHLSTARTSEGTALIIDIRLFCRHIVRAARQWLTGVSGTSLFQNNYRKFIALYPNGLAPYVTGSPALG